MNGILISTAAFNSLSTPAQQEVLKSIGLGNLNGTATAAPAPIRLAPVGSINGLDGEGPVELTVAMVRKLTDKLGDKTLNTLKIIARSDSTQFHMREVIDGISGAKDYMDMRGVWSALTRRTRKIMGDSDVDLIWWNRDSIDDADGNYIDHIGSISPLTYQSLRAHFGL